MSAPTIPVAKPLLGEEEVQAVAEAIRSGMIASGPRVAAFEEAFARYVGARHAVAVGNATVGLHATLVAMGIGPGDEVIVPAFTFIATANTVLLAGATPVLVDVDPATFNLDLDRVEEALSERTRAVVPVHLYGNPADMRPLGELAERHDLEVLGDAAQAHGAAIGSQRVGTFGHAECFSFYPTKNMTTGEGGIITTNDAALAEAIRSFVNHGRARSELGTYDHVRLGHNFRLTDIGAAIGLVQLAKLDGWNAKRRENARRLNEGLAKADLVTPRERAGTTHVFHQYTVRSPDRDALVARLKQNGVGYGIYYPKPLYAYPHLAPYARACPEAERAAREVVSLPVHPALTQADLERIVQAAC